MTNAVATTNHDLVLAGPVGSLDAYIQAVGSVAVLSKEDEQALAHRFRDEEDLEAARQLVMAHLRFVEDKNGDVIDNIVYCSDSCHRNHRVLDWHFAFWK